MTDRVEVRITSQAYGGDALGRLTDGRVVFVPYAIPGELVRVRLVEEKPHFTRAELVDVLEPEAERVNPRCLHFTTCGGCHYQHMSYTAQVATKATLLKDQLARIGGLKDIPDIVVEAGADAWYYRNHIQFHLTEDGYLGFQRAHSNRTFTVKECHLPETAISKAWPLIDLEPIYSLERISLRSGVEGELMLILEGSNLQPLEISIEDMPISVVQLDALGRTVLAGSDHLIMEVLNKCFKVSAASFFQVNTLKASAVVEQMLASLQLTSNMTVLDVYCGVGLFSAFLAPKVERLVGIELSPDACEDFSANLDEYDNVSLYEAPAEHVLSSLTIHPDVIIVDPPRDGLGKMTVTSLLALGAQTLVYVSCDPATMARDAKWFVAGGYRLDKIMLVDMFPQTYHIESVGYWQKS